MTTAKQKSKNSFAISEYYPSSDGKHILKNVTKIEVVEKAFLNNDISLWLQPIFDCQRGKIVGAESLIRWYYNDSQQFAPDIYLEALYELSRLEDSLVITIKSLTICLPTWKGYLTDGYLIILIDGI